VATQKAVAVIHGATLGSFVLSVLAYAPPVALAALGGVLAERAGVINIGLEGMMRFGAFFGAWASLATSAHVAAPWLGLLSGALAGAACGALLGALAVWTRADQIVAGIAINLLALGLVTFLLEWAVGASGGITDPVPMLPSLSLGPLGRLPAVASSLAREPRSLRPCKPVFEEVRGRPRVLARDA